MSQIHDAQYRLERERRQQIANQRVRDTTATFIDRYQGELEKMHQQGLVEYVQHEYEQCLSELSQIRAQLDSQPFEARERSKSLGDQVYSLRNTARQLKQQIEETRYQQHLEALEARITAEKQRKAAISTIWTKVLRNWSDKLSLNLMLKDIKALEQQVFADKSTIKEEDLIKQLQQLKQQGAEKAIKHRTLTQQQVQATTNRDITDAVKEVVIKSLPKDKAAVLTEQLNTILTNDVQDTSKQLEKITKLTTQADQQIEDEAIRKETVKAVYNTLKATGFTVQKPKLVAVENGEQEVVIGASRPAGNSAEFKIRLDGSCTYKFDNYKGQTCKKDINKVLPKLSEVYGVDLSDSRVIWSNPDDEDAEMKPIPSQTMQSKG